MSFLFCSLGLSREAYFFQRLKVCVCVKCGCSKKERPYRKYTLQTLPCFFHLKFSGLNFVSLKLIQLILQNLLYFLRIELEIVQNSSSSNNNNNSCKIITTTTIRTTTTTIIVVVNCVTCDCFCSQA